MSQAGELPPSRPVPLAPASLDESRIFALDRPDPRLWTYYLITSFAAGPFFFIPLIYRSFRYRTLRYRFDDEGISMRWGVLFRREINLTYNRIQDIHLASNAIARWLGLAEIQIQTASGSAQAEMTIEGVLEYDALRDFLYSRMRGTRRKTKQPGPAVEDIGGAAAAEIAKSLRAVTEELRALRAELARRSEDDR